MINVFQPSLGKEEIGQIEKVFASNWLGKGKIVDQFEEKFAKHLGIGKQHILTMGCCTEGLFSSMKILEIGKNDEIIVPSLSFVGAANAVCDNGSKLVFCDVDSRSLNVTAMDIEKKISAKTKAILLLHYGGVPCDMDEIMKMADSYNIKVIEDSACSVASKYKGKACGTIGDIGIWSFDAMKILVCGDGGALYVKDEEKAQFAEKLMYFGLETKSGFSNTIDSKWWEFEISQFGHRSIMNDITASMALVQLDKLKTFIDRRREIHNIYNENLKGVNWIDLPPAIDNDCESSYYFYHIQTQNDKRDELAIFLKKNDIYTTYRYYPLHWVKQYGVNDTLPQAEYAAKNTLCLPIHQALTNDEVYYIIDKIKEFSRIYQI